MRVVLQRISEALVTCDGVPGPKVGMGLLALVGFRHGDSDSMLEPMAEKIVNLRIFDGEDGRMDRSLLDCGGELVVVSQFTLYADCRKGRRPGLSGAMHAADADILFERFCNICGKIVAAVNTGVFGAHMQVHLVNDGPVTILLDSAELGLE